MQTKSLLYGLVGFFIGGLTVAVAATTFDRPETMSDMTASLEGKTGDAYDKAFMSGMITHHQDAVDMARLSANSAKHEEIKRLSRDIIAAQQKEIDLMRQWQTDWGYGTMDDHTQSSH